jgi:hypothetical protein
MDLKINIPKSTQELNIDEIIRESTIEFGDKFEKPDPLITFIEGTQEKLVMNCGGISGILGIQKSRKTFFMTLVMSAAVKNGIIDEKIRGYSYGKINYWLDTEQSRYYTSKIAYRITRKLGLKSHPENFKLLSIKRYSPEDRLRILEYIVDNTKNLGLIVLDTLHRFIYDFNNLKESTMLLDKLMGMADRSNCHFACVLHVNPLKKGEDKKPRGHLGTELQNLAESTILIEKSKFNKSYSTITPRDFRDQEINNYAMLINDYGIPEIIDVEQQKEEKLAF